MKQLKISILILFVFTIITGVIYPLLITGIGMVFFHEKTNGSLIKINGTITGSELVGQKFERPEFFQGRPSSVNYDSVSSGASNYGPTNKKFIEDVKTRVVQIRKDFKLSGSVSLPSDFVFASGSGLDPHISKESAILQADRIASARGIDKSIIGNIVNKNLVNQYYFYGHSYVNVLKMNIELIEKGYLK